MKRASLLGLFLSVGLAFGAFAHAEGEQTAADPSAVASGDPNRGGSFCISPALFMPASTLGTAFYPGGIWNLDFDIGVNPSKSVIFGVGYSDLGSRSNSDAHLVMVPAWFGFKSKNQFVPSVETFWSMAGELYYEKSYVSGHTGTGSLENLDGGVVAGAGFDLWLTKWLLAGVDSRAHFAIEAGQVFPFVELGLRIGLRG